MSPAVQRHYFLSCTGRPAIYPDDDSQIEGDFDLFSIKEAHAEDLFWYDRDAAADMILMTMATETGIFP